MSIAIFTTGGTIDKLYFDAKSEFHVGDSEVPEFLDGARVTIPIRLESLLRKDSLDMNDNDRALIRRHVAADPAARILVTHGTDTMIDTAQVLVGIPGKTIVLTGAMRPSRLRVSDAAFNIGFAFAAVQLLPPGVYLAMHGEILNPARARKNRAAGRFEAES
jgi:L-asparaginase